MTGIQKKWWRVRSEMRLQNRVVPRLLFVAGSTKGQATRRHSGDDGEALWQGTEAYGGPEKSLEGHMLGPEEPQLTDSCELPEPEDPAKPHLAPTPQQLGPMNSCCFQPLRFVTQQSLTHPAICSPASRV